MGRLEGEIGITRAEGNETSDGQQKWKLRYML